MDKNWTVENSIVEKNSMKKKQNQLMCVCSVLISSISLLIQQNIKTYSTEELNIL